MADDLFAFSRDSIARIWRAVTAVERYLLTRTAGDPAGQRSRRLPRTYRTFTLTANLDAAAASPAVTWSDGTTGVVTDPEGACWGLVGEKGEAAAYADGDVIQWRVTKNPGSACYKGTFHAATTSSPADVDVDIGGNTRTVSCILGRTPTSGKKYASGGVCFVSAFAGVFYVIAVVDCEVAV